MKSILVLSLALLGHAVCAAPSEYFTVSAGPVSRTLTLALGEYAKKAPQAVVTRNGKLIKPKRLPSNLYQFREGTGQDRVVLDCITSLQNGLDLLWIET